MMAKPPPKVSSSAEVPVLSSRTSSTAALSASLLSRISSPTMVQPALRELVVKWENMNKDMNLEQRVDAIEQRNAGVEKDKTWETSWTRRLIITILTYVVAGFYMSVIDINNPWTNAIIPAGGYFLSTMGLKVVRYYWESKEKN